MSDEELSSKDKLEAPAADSSPSEEIRVEVAAGESQAKEEESRGPSREEIIEALQKSREEAKALRDKMLRVLADADNQRKRLAREREEIIKFGQEKLMRDLLTPLDNLERSLAHLPDECADPNLASLREGVSLVLRQFQDTLAGYGLREFSALGQKFDPNLHEAIEKIEGAGVPPDTVVAETSKGYLLHDRLLRPALVTVTVASAGGAATEGDTAETEEKGESD